MDDRALALRLAKEIAASGGRAYYVGGYVRDALLGIENKDIDMEVHGLAPETLRNILSSFGQVMTIGESFGIYAIKGVGIDIAMPRRERAVGTGHRDFEVSVDPFIGTEGAARRRDFTINAMMQDVLTGEIVDPFGGREDLQKGILRHVNDESFAEDPLRVLRGAQFSARFGFPLAPETVLLCSRMAVAGLSRERIEEEMKKALLKAKTPSVFFQVLRQTRQLHDWFPEAERLIGVPQPPLHHGEGDVWNHTMMVLDAAAKYRDRVESPMALMTAALTHDFGKPDTTAQKDGVWHAYGHETAGVPVAETFLRRVTGENRLIANVLNLTRLHMKPNVLFGAGSSVKATNRMYDETPLPLTLVYLAIADDEGRITDNRRDGAEAFLLERLEIYREMAARPCVTGKDLLAAGLAGGPAFTDYLAYARKLHLAGVAKDEALKQTLAYARKKARA